MNKSWSLCKVVISTQHASYNKESLSCRYRLLVCEGMLQTFSLWMNGAIYIMDLSSVLISENLACLI